MKRALALKFFFVALCPIGFAQAHSSGHGPVIEGRGPNGGKLTAIVTAKDADLGEKAPIKAVAEWSRGKNGEFKIHLWDAGVKNALKLSSADEIKWILLGAEKPLVKKLTGKPAASAIENQFVATELMNVKQIEVILPGLDKVQEKTVFMMSL